MNALHTLKGATSAAAEAAEDGAMLLRDALSYIDDAEEQTQGNATGRPEDSKANAMQRIIAAQGYFTAALRLLSRVKEGAT